MIINTHLEFPTLLKALYYDFHPFSTHGRCNKQRLLALLVKISYKSCHFLHELHSLGNHHLIRKHHLLELSTLTSAFQNDGPQKQETERLETDTMGWPSRNCSLHICIPSTRLCDRHTVGRHLKVCGIEWCLWEMFLPSSKTQMKKEKNKRGRENTVKFI